MEALMKATDALKSLKETRLSGLRAPMEFFDFHRISRPAGLDEAVQRISYNTRYFSGNYGLIVAVLAVYAIIVNPLLLISLAFLTLGFIAINKFGADPMQVGDHVVTQKSLYTVLFVVGIPMLWLSSPLGTFFWLVGASSVLILGHATVMELGVESEYGTVQDAV